MRRGVSPPTSAKLLAWSSSPARPPRAAASLTRFFLIGRRHHARHQIQKKLKCGLTPLGVAFLHRPLTFLRYGSRDAPAFVCALGRAQGTDVLDPMVPAGRTSSSGHDWNMLPIGQQLWLKELESYEKYPPLQAPETYNLSGILEQVKKANAGHASD
jgi:hypothetical protein